jgi:hypothetical protein
MMHALHRPYYGISFLVSVLTYRFYGLEFGNFTLQIFNQSRDNHNNDIRILLLSNLIKTIVAHINQC